jgi:putative ABC transport system substrate-binding protein
MQYGQLQRREFITLLGAVLASPRPAHAQQPTMPVIGFLSSLRAIDASQVMAAFRQGIAEAGYVEGQNVTIDYRWAAGEYDRLPALAADLVKRQVTVIAAISGTPAALAAKQASGTIPIVFAIGSDPVTFGLVTALNRPAGNLTGTTFFTASLGQKRMELLRELVPNASTVGLLVDLDNPASAADATNAQDAAHAIGLQTKVLNVRTSSEFDRAFSTFVREKLDALYVGPDPLFVNERDRIVALVDHHDVHAIYGDREITEAGGLISYGASRKDAYRQAGAYVGRILNGEKPGDLPVTLPAKFELVINLKTAKARGLTIPANVLALSDEVIE